MREKAPSKVEVVLLALANLGAESEPVDTEDVAMEAYRLAPEAFSWRRYPEQVDLDSVRVTLFDACKTKYGERAGGSVRRGWHLTANGLTLFANEVMPRVRHLGVTPAAPTPAEPATVGE